MIGASAPFPVVVVGRTTDYVPGGGGVDQFRIQVRQRCTQAVVCDTDMGAADSALPSTVLNGSSVTIHER